MSQALMSASDIGLPSFGVGAPGVWANAATAPNDTPRRGAAEGLRIDMFYLPFAVDAPTCDAVVMLVGEGQSIGQRLPRLPPRRDEFGAQRLDVAGLVPGAALQNRRLAIPAPRHVEAGERLVVDRPLQRGFAPT